MTANSSRTVQCSELMALCTNDQYVDGTYEKYQQELFDQGYRYDIQQDAWILRE